MVSDGIVLVVAVSRVVLVRDVVSEAEVLVAMVITVGLRVIVSGVLVLGDVVVGAVVLVSAVSRARFSEAVVLGTVVYCLLCRGLR